MCRQSAEGVPSFQISICRDLRETLSAGFIEIHNGLFHTSRPLILVPDRFCTKPIIPLKLVIDDDGSNMSSLSLLLATGRRFLQLGFSDRRFTPLHQIDDHSHQWGYGISSCIKGWGFHPTMKI